MVLYDEIVKPARQVVFVRQFQPIRYVAYDGFGTFTFSETGGKPNDEHYKRVVFVQVENAKWQEARYCSGLYAPVKREIDPLIKGYIEEQLFTRMEGGLS